MRPSKTITWDEVYHQIALALQKLYKKHKANAGVTLFRMVNDSSIYKKHNSWLSNMGRIKNSSIEPIQLFVSFSRSRQDEKIRLELINEVSRLLGMKKKWSSVNFEGCPAPMALKLQYIRPEPVQARIWQMFDNVMKDGKKALSKTVWEEAKTWRGIQIPSFTIFLFWVNSKEFLPFDKNTKQYLERCKLLKPNTGTIFEVYEGLLNNQRIKSYTNLSIEAYYFINQPKIFKNRFGKSSLISDDKTNSTFRLVGLRTLSRNSKVHKILKPKQYYPIDFALAPSEISNQKAAHIENFIFDNKEQESLYNQQDLKINITAIVGKNGSGKSTLLDLIFMGIYNLSINLKFLDETYKNLPQLNFEVYWQTDTLYKLVFGKEILYYGFRPISNKDGTIVYELNKTPKSLSNLNENFFYSILINYSHYALNSTDYKLDWITPLSHKNDGYTTPLVLNPKRTKGNIDVNNEKNLLNVRLLINLLELHDADFPKQSFRCIDNNKSIKYFSLNYDERKQKEKKIELEERFNEDTTIVPRLFNKVSEIFDLQVDEIGDIPYNAAIMYYLINKMYTIVERYDKYKFKYLGGLEFFTKQNIATTVEISLHDLEHNLLSVVSSILEDIKNDNSHITLKFRQAINYLKYSTLREILIEAVKTNGLIELDTYNVAIDEIKYKEKDVVLSVVELLPPPIFSLEFYLDDVDKSSFNKASSGEYQLVSVLSSLLYHIRNIDSTEGENRYNYITVLLDEIELYFHPNMQRLFIKKLLDALSKLEIEIYGIHVLFATHSPFILSDIQQQKILKLKNGEVEQKGDSYNTFAANIHDLLADEFFLDEGYLGAFAQKQIEQAINILNYIIAENELKNLSLNPHRLTSKEITILKQKWENELTLYEARLKLLGFWNDKRNIENWNAENEKPNLFELIEIIGEPLIKEKLSKMFNNAFVNDKENTKTNSNNAKQTILNIMKDNNINHEDLL